MSGTVADVVGRRGRRAAGILYLDDGGRALLLRRAEGSQHAGTWALPGGSADHGETPEQAARRESREEIGYEPGELEWLEAAYNGTTEYHTFLAREWPTVQLNDEHTDWRAVPGHALEAPEGGRLHPGLEATLNRLRGRGDVLPEPRTSRRDSVAAPAPETELDAARGVRDGLIQSGARYENMYLFALRITGTGVAYRPQLKEFAYRPPEEYLNEEFLRRCNGLAVIMLHPQPDHETMTSEDYIERNVGSIMLPYIKGDEVWGIAKVYDEDAADLLRNHQFSTSPGVLFPAGENRKVRVANGDTVLIEGKPGLVDHLAICEQGVWDKAGDPTGVDTNNTGVTEVAEEKKVPEVKADASDAGEKLDKVLACMDSVMDGFKSFGARMDALEEEHRNDRAKWDAEKAKWDAAKKDADGEGEKFPEEIETMPEETAADRAKKDAAKKDWSAKKDAEAGKEPEAKSLPPFDEERAKKDADEKEGIRRRIDELEKAVPKQLSDSEEAEMTEAQAKADSVHGLFGTRAPRFLPGESRLAYRKRLVKGLQQHSKSWKDTDVTVLPEAAFAVIEGQVFHDAATAARNPVDVPDGQLLERTTVDQLTGVRRTEFHGRPRAWMGSFAGNVRKVSHIKNHTN